jgi:hypothetical protein
VNEAPFCGRESELAALLAEWEAATLQRRPRTVAVLGEPGLGKTRLVQAFFGALSTRAGGGYWPAVLGRLGNNLQVNPDADPTRSGAPPFLWWGLRLVDPLVPNSVGAGVLASGVENHLKPQLAHFQHLKRRKERRDEALSIGKGVVLDIAIDFIPFAGIAKTLGEAGADLHRLYREGRPAATTTAADPLVEDTLDALQLAIAPDNVVPRPAVILIDDAQYSTHDPGVVAFVEALVARATQGGWPLLLLVTHWEREWDAPAPRSVAAVLTAAGITAARTIRLAPVPDLSPMLRAGLPGLTLVQQRTLLERADGNPRFLGEMILFASASRGLFVRGDVAGEMSANGLARLVSRSTSLHELTAARLRDSPPEVQDAVCLASLQGVEFLNSVLGGMAERLYRDSGALAAAVGTAERPHAYVRAVDAGVAAFAQRIYFEVAAEHLENCFDPDEARHALRERVREIAANARLDDYSPVELRRLLALGAALFEAADDIADQMIAASFLYQLAKLAEADSDLHTWRALVRRLDAMIARTGDELLDADLDWLREIYLAADGPEARDTEARVIGQMNRLTAEALADHENDWTIWMHVRALALLAEHQLNCNDPGSAMQTAVAANSILQRWPQEDRTPSELAAWLEVYGAAARALTAMGHAQDALTFHEAQLRIADLILDRDPDHAGATWVRTSTEQKMGALAWQTDDTERSIRHLEAAIAKYRAFAAGGRLTPDLPGALCALALVIHPQDSARARTLRAEALELSRELVARSDDLDHRRILAWALFEMASGMVEDPQAALRLAREASAIMARDGDDPFTSAERGARVEGFVVELCLVLGIAAEALPHALRTLALARIAVSRSPTPDSRRTLLVALLQLARIELAVGDQGSAALRIDEAGQLLDDPEFAQVSGLDGLAQALRDLAGAQQVSSRLH